MIQDNGSNPRELSLQSTGARAIVFLIAVGLTGCTDWAAENTQLLAASSTAQEWHYYDDVWSITSLRNMGSSLFEFMAEIEPCRDLRVAKGARDKSPDEFALRDATLRVAQLEGKCRDAAEKYVLTQTELPKLVKVVMNVRLQQYIFGTQSFAIELLFPRKGGHGPDPIQWTV